MGDSATADPTLTDEQHDWATKFSGINTRPGGDAGPPGGQPGQPADPAPVTAAAPAQDPPPTPDLAPAAAAAPAQDPPPAPDPAPAAAPAQEPPPAPDPAPAAAAPAQDPPPAPAPDPAPAAAVAPAQDPPPAPDPAPVTAAAPAQDPPPAPDPAPVTAAAPAQDPPPVPDPASVIAAAPAQDPPPAPDPAQGAPAATQVAGAVPISNSPQPAAATDPAPGTAADPTQPNPLSLTLPQVGNPNSGPSAGPAPQLQLDPIQPPQQNPDPMTLTQPQVGTPPDGPNAGPAPQLHFQLTDQDKAACDKFLTAHFDAEPARGTDDSIAQNYHPTLDGVPVSMDTIIGRLVPLTGAGAASKDGSDQLFKDAVGQISDLITDRLSKIAAKKSADAAARNKAAVEQGGANSGIAQAEAEEWIENFLNTNGLAPDPAGDGTGRNVLFGNKTTLIASVVNATLEAAKSATFQQGEDTRALIDAKLVARIISEVLLKKIPIRSSGKVPDLSLQIGWNFLPDGTTHTTADGTTTKDEPTNMATGLLNIAFHADDESGWELGAAGQIAVFPDGKKTGGRLQSGLAGVQVAWVWSFLQGALQAGPLLNALAGSSRAQKEATGKIEWSRTGQVGIGGQVQYAAPGFDGHLLVGVQAGSSGTVAQGAKPTIDNSTALTFVWKF